MGREQKLESRCKVPQNAATRQLRTREGGWRPGRAAGSFVGDIVEGYASSDCAIRVVAAPLLVSSGGCTRVESK